MERSKNGKAWAPRQQLDTPRSRMPRPRLWQATCGSAPCSHTFSKRCMHTLRQRPCSRIAAIICIISRDMAPPGPAEAFDAARSASVARV